MKESITSLDLKFLIEEIKEEVLGSRIRKIKEVNGSLAIEIFKNKKNFLKIIPGRAVYTLEKLEKAREPSSFCMQLRKHLTNKKILNFFQVGFDRVVEIWADSFKLIIELFSNGNIVLANSSGEIIGCLRKEVWRTRRIKPKETYRYPPSNLNPFELDFEEFEKKVKGFDKEIVKVLATDFGLSGTYAEEICERLKIDKKKLSSELERKEIEEIYNFLKGLEKIELKPSIILEEGRQADVVPFEMVKYEKKKKIEFKNFVDAVREYFENLEKEKKRKEEEKVEEKKGKILEVQKIGLQKLKEKEEEYRKSAEALYKNYQIASEILNSIESLREKKLGWKEIEEKIKKQKVGKYVKKIEPSEAKVEVEFNGLTISLDFRKSVEENANRFFEKAKKTREKIKGAEKAIKKFEARVEEKRGKEWYERFRWFRSSDGFLVVAGKDAKSNEILVRRYAKDDDMVFHADIRGAPFVVIKNEKHGKIPEQTIKEAAEFAASFSRAWKLKSWVNVFCMKPKDLVKEPGLPLGSFRIKEKSVIKKVVPRVAIGIKDESIIYGPLEAVKSQTPYFVLITPGDKKAEQLAKEIKDELAKKVPEKIAEKIKLEEIEDAIPFKTGELAL